MLLEIRVPLKIIKWRHTANINLSDRENFGKNIAERANIVEQMFFDLSHSSYRTCPGNYCQVPRMLVAIIWTNTSDLKMYPFATLLFIKVTPLETM